VELDELVGRRVELFSAQLASQECCIELTHIARHHRIRGGLFTPHDEKERQQTPP
jgi:hypothetical protein